MNKLIKKLVESLFDDIDDIVDTNIQNDKISKEIVNQDIKDIQKYQPYDVTKFPEDYIDFEHETKLYKIGDIYIQTALKNTYYIKYYNEVKKFAINCKFKGYDNFDIDTVEIYSFDMMASGTFFKKCILQINGNVIENMIFDIRQEPNEIYNYEFLYNNYHGKALYMNIFYLINAYIDNNYVIKNIIINVDQIQLYCIKNICLGFDIKSDIFNINKISPIKDEYINTYKNIKIQVNGKVRKLTALSKIFVFDKCSVFYDLKSFESFLFYLKKMGFTRLKMENQPYIMNPGDYNGFYYGEDLFKQFLIDNNIKTYTFREKKDKDEILRIITNKAIQNLKQNNELSVDEMHYMSSDEIINKGKDEKGDYIIIKLKIDYDDKKVKDHVYYNTIWKFYSSGLYELENEDLYWSKKK